MAEPAKIKAESKRCDLCDGTEFELIARHDRRGKELLTGVCKQCGLVSHWNIPSEVNLQDFYATRYRREYHGELTPSARRVMRAWRNAKRIQSQLEPSLKPGSDIFDDRRGHRLRGQGVRTGRPSGFRRRAEFRIPGFFQESVARPRRIGRSMGCSDTSGSRHGAIDSRHRAFPFSAASSATYSSHPESGRPALRRVPESRRSVRDAAQAVSFRPYPQFHARHLANAGPPLRLRSRALVLDAGRSEFASAAEARRFRSVGNQS